MKLIEKLPSVETVSKTGKRRMRAMGRFYCPICKSYVEKDLYNGQKVVSCGSKDCTPSKSFRHGYVGTQVYNSWRGMKARCDNPDEPAYRFYGGKGITYPEKWKTFEGFLEDMGDCLDKDMSIDRIDNTKSYSKENCQWLSMDENRQKNKYKEVIKVDAEGNELARYASCQEAERSEGLGSGNGCSVARVARGERKAYKDTYWRYSDGRQDTDDR